MREYNIKEKYSTAITKDGKFAYHYGYNTSNGVHKNKFHFLYMNRNNKHVHMPLSYSDNGQFLLDRNGNWDIFIIQSKE